MTANVGKIDRILRAVIGVILLFVALSGTVSGGLFWLVLVVGAVMLATSAMKFCPAYRLLGKNTCNM
ncbi:MULTISPECIES: YgaP family membrane protein [unclassified Meridianimarinicoccus]|uniref:YgaP family membrane protein n=1 Tax=unclassified Meridianimarinicoccus TaxID=2923344 RepID=UPI0018693487|nr:DUF2892 domain-containing protein [Fluviibacterium sp. MJW13]